MQNIAFLEFIQKIGVVDGKNVSDADINLKWTAVISNSDK